MKKNSLVELAWIEELLPAEVNRRPMFGGFAYYWHEKMILALFEKTGDRSYLKKTYPFELWCGALFPVEKIFHDKILANYPELLSHPIIGKWLYLPLETENFESIVESISKEFLIKNSFWGVIPKTKKSKLREAQSKGRISKENKKNELDLKMDTSKPSMFKDFEETPQNLKAKNFADLKNLGPQSAKAFKKAGIDTPDKFLKMGWELAFEKLVKSDPKNRHSVFAYALIGAEKNQIWHRISEEDKKKARELSASLKLKYPPIKKNKK